MGIKQDLDFKIYEMKQLFKNRAKQILKINFILFGVCLLLFFFNEDRIELNNIVFILIFVILVIVPILFKNIWVQITYLICYLIFIGYILFQI